ncbi:MAG: CPBP family intramembrane glutamic endopeptidase [Planctomycetota bacterium]
MIVAQLLLNSTLVILGIASVAVWVMLASKLVAGESILPYQLRQRVPWGGGAGTIAIVIMAINFLAAPGPQTVADESVSETLTSQQVLEGGISAVVVYTIFIGTIVMLLTSTVGATRRDFGVPASVAQLASDIRLGLLTALAALVPSYGVHLVLVQLVKDETIHPVLLQVMSQPDLKMAIGAFLTAGLMVPVLEEFTFRLLLQGWLEKLEDQYVGWTATKRRMPAADEQADSDEPDHAAQQSADDANPFASPRTNSDPPPESSTDDIDEAIVDESARRQLVSLTGLPHGWAPVLASALLFALAHLGLGAAPFALFVFAVLLGFVYQRTHRILPCIVAHMAFNTLSLVLVWSQASSS